MADAVPASDVLCEATEYLSKLGSNLRVRTENLKDKRIRKDKLQNVHAVRKAATKVLLICELSKKSIENVETGIQKILAHLSASQTSEDGGKSIKKESSKSEQSTHSAYFIYNSRKLKIRKKVNLKHYMSVNVKATALSADFYDKYPVYHDCKLYRMRKRKDKEKVKELENTIDRNEEKKTDTIVSNVDDGDRMLSTVSPVVDSSDTINNCEESNAKKKRKLSNAEENVSDMFDKRSSSPLRKDSETTHNDTIGNECSSQSNENDLEKEIPESPNKTDNTLSDDRSSLPLEVNSERESKKKPNKNKFKNIKVFEDSSDSDKASVKSNSDNDNLHLKDNSIQNSTTTESVVCENNELINKDGNERQSDIESNKMKVTASAKECNENNKNSDELESHSEIENPIKKRKISSDKTDEIKNSNIQNPVEESIDHIEENDKDNKESESKEQSDRSYHQNENSEIKAETRPLIKCVSISKLLKADRKSILEISDSDNEEDKHKQKKSKSSKHGKSKQDKKTHKMKEKIDRNKKSVQDDNDEEYWKEKRKEVKNFISKKFHIKVKRMPKLSEKYLAAHHIVKVIHNGSVVCERSKTLSNKDSIMSNDIDTNKDKETQKAISDIDVFKNALLNDSESDKSDSEMAKTKQTIDEYLNNPRSDNSEGKISNKSKDKKNLSENDTDKLDVYNSNNIEKQKTPEPESQKTNRDIETDIVKSSLMKDSSDENLEKSDSKKRRKSDSITPSKRKHIMESMHAKKMLLTYSSSSDTEDEQLRNALKEIRNSLLQDTIEEPKKSNVEDTSEEKKKSDNSGSDSDVSDNTKKESKKNIKSDETKSCKNTETEENNQSESSKSSKQHRKGSREENSNSSSKKMSDGNGSSNINSDIEDQIDKDIDGLTNLKTLNKKSRRRRSSEESDRRTRSKMPKAPQISEEGFLKAESSSDEASAAESDVPGEETEIPTVPASGLNGDAISHLAKDDLLGDSDDSSDKNTSQQDTQNNDSSDENLTTKRRKAHALSSDSEAGSSRKDRVRMSDFEDSDDDTSEPAKRAKRKKKGSDSDASASSSIDGTKKKRKRIKNIDESEGSGSENDGKNKHGRKNIRKVMGKNQLEEATKKAAREEKERIARIAERQKLYNNLEFDETGKPDEVVLDKVVLDFDPETKEPLIEVDKGLVKKLKPHQANGIKFMWDACFESVKRIKKDKGSGCILAHCMGLGKTLQVVTLTHTLLTHGDLTGVNRVLVVCPLSTVLNWVNEFRMWLKHTHNDLDLDVYELSRYKQNSERAHQLQQWYRGGGVCVLGYEMFRNLSADNNKKFKKKMLSSFQESLVDPGPDLVVCDEGHLLKNEKTSLSQAMNRICTLRRIVLTGTPLQNNLKEYYCMVQFVKPNLLGKYNEYLNRFVNPITNGQYTDSTEHDIRVMKRRSHVLHKMLDGAVQRRDYGVLAPFLPPKHEYVLFITLTDVQVKLYQEYLDNYSRRPLPGKSSGFLFPDFQSLQRIWTHPLVLKYNSERYEIMQQKKREREEEDSEGSLADFIDDDSTPDESSTEETSDDSSDMSDDSRKKGKKKKAGKKKGKEGRASARRGTRANPIEPTEEEEAPVEETRAENPTEWWMRLVGDDELEDLRNSHKLVLLFDILRQCETIGDKLLVFSQSLYSLDLIEHFLGKVDEASQEGRVDEKLNGHVGSWSPGVDYFRLDGSTSCENRSIWCKNFNREDNPRARLFLISTRAGGLGINLVAANRVVIFDVSWNPSHDVQSIFRVYRFGQKKPCYVYRFLAMGTMEEKIYERQVTKQAISKRVIDEQQIDRHYAENDLAELYKFEPRPEAPRELPPLPKDRLFAEMLREHEAQIYKYHEHDSLLENKEEETLTEEERKAAWEDFENEKTRPPPTPFAGPYGVHNGMMPGLLAQQQQLAFAAVAAMLRKDMPNINDNQIRDMLPLIYQANPGLMQKMTEIYKYAQPGMMNPGMMNPVMNSGGGGMGMGGSSGLQYEPPWQRQQQQQQQMRLQQLLQQQQNMGAKFYAGGLGSRDPVAMALQQQRAREMMLGERQRPRGRPPQRAAPVPSGDVVNLDSD